MAGSIKAFILLDLCLNYHRSCHRIANYGSTTLGKRLKVHKRTLEKLV